MSRTRSEEHTSELQSPCNLVCRLLLEKKKKNEKTVTRKQTTHYTRAARSTAGACAHALCDVVQRVCLQRDFSLFFFFFFFFKGPPPPRFLPPPPPAPFPT